MHQCSVSSSSGSRRLCYGPRCVVPCCSPISISTAYSDHKIYTPFSFVIPPPPPIHSPPPPPALHSPPPPDESSGTQHTSRSSTLWQSGGIAWICTMGPLHPTPFWTTTPRLSSCYCRAVRICTDFCRRTLTTLSQCIARLEKAAQASS